MRAGSGTKEKLPPVLARGKRGCGTFVMENHDEAYSIWRRSSHQRRTLVHVDAHHDMWWITDPKCMTIANFISIAIQHEIVERMYWVVPDASWTGSNRDHLVSHLRELLNTYPNSSRSIVLEPTSASLVIYGRPFTVCSVSSLPPLPEKVLLDIDVDFFIIPKVTYGAKECHGPLPWCWPDEFVKSLRKACITSDCVTIAYSVEGGYCPLRWKYLGDELRLRLQGPVKSDPNQFYFFDTMRQAAMAARRQDWAGAIRSYRECADVSLGSAAACYNLAQALLHEGRIREARKFHSRAVAADPSYATAYSSSGFHHSWSGRFRAARRGHRRALSLDPENAAAYLGLAQVSAHNRQWQEAERLFRKALKFDPRLVDAYRGLSKAASAQARYADAADYLQKAFILSASGCTPLAAPIITMPAVRGGSQCDLGHIIKTWGIAR